jgi:hypothetical protein
VNQQEWFNFLLENHSAVKMLIDINRQQLANQSGPTIGIQLAYISENAYFSAKHKWYAT